MNVTCPFSKSLIAWKKIIRDFRICRYMRKPDEVSQDLRGLCLAALMKGYDKMSKTNFEEILNNFLDKSYKDLEASWDAIKESCLKQIPKKVYVEDYVGQYDVNLGRIYYCPECKNLLCFELGFPRKETEYCSSCGQALDWSE